MDGSDGPVQHTREVYRDTKGIPFEIRDEYGVAKVNGELEPAASDFKTDWEHHNCPGRFEEVFWSLYQRSPKTRLRKKGTLRQRYTDLLPGQHVSVYGEMTVESDSQGQPEGCFLWNVKSSTKPNPDFDSLIYKPTSRRQSVEAIFGLLLIVVPVAYIFWRASQE